MNEEQLQELLLQSLEHEKGGVLVYETAVKCAVNEDLKEEWEEYLEQTRTHVATLEDVCSVMGIDAEQASPGCDIIRHLGIALVEAMEKARATGDAAAAQLVACECVVLAETKDHLDWELLGQCAKKLTGDQAQALKEACEEVEEEEDEHLYHTKGWCRELWLESLGLKAVLPPPEERKHVTTAIGAARAEQASIKSRRGSGSKTKQRVKA
jgi:ferritin-like metal-binding protein YciE